MAEADPAAETLVRSGFGRCDLPEMVKGSFFCSMVTGLLGLTARGAKRKSCRNVGLQWISCWHATSQHLFRAQNEIAEALLHIDCLSDCLNREIIMSAASSEATEQLVASAGTTLVQVQNMLATQSDEGARRLREAQVAFITTRRDRSSSTSASHASDPYVLEPDHQASRSQSCSTERIPPS